MLGRTKHDATAPAVLLVVSVLLAGFGGLGKAASGSAWANGLTDGVAVAIEARLAEESDRPRGAAEHAEFLALQTFYLERGYAPAWLAADGLTGQGRALATVLQNAWDNGLEPSDYGVGRIQALRQASGGEGRGQLDYLLSRMLLRYGRDLHSGRVKPGEVDRELFIYPRSIDPLGLLAEATVAEDIAGYLADLAPDSREYLRLKNALSAYRALARQGGWRPLPQGETLKPSMSDPRVPLLRERLIQIGDLAPTSVSAELTLFYDDSLVEAVKRFQFRHGLEQDGAVGKKTLAALNVPVEARIEQMLLNMERRRWMAGDRPRDNGGSYIFVNLADFELKVVDGERTIFDSRVVVGTSYHRTPVFSGEMTYLELNPYWNVPPSIARKELLPKIKQDVSYLAQQNMRVFSGWDGAASELDPTAINWAAVSAGSFPYKLRQDPGEGNALGRVKFMFPNRFNVYLHDTPSRALFQRTVRSFSHGCIRVQYPLELAELLLRNDPAWSPERIEAVIASGKRQVVTLKQPMPVHITYLTAWVNKDGSVHFRDDIYGRDKRLADALQLSRSSLGRSLAQ
ncbi:MAG: murein L,D-transpeptidase [Kiloniellales bacterium]